MNGDGVNDGDELLELPWALVVEVVTTIAPPKGFMQVGGEWMLEKKVFALKSRMNESEEAVKDAYGTVAEQGRKGSDADVADVDIGEGEVCERSELPKGKEK